MVQNKEQLRQEAQAWIAQASQDLSGRFNDFIRQNEVDVDELADVLDISADTLDYILHGDVANITAETLIKLFIANDLAVEIKPVSETPIGNFGPMGGRMPMPPRGTRIPMGAPIPPRGGFGRRPVAAAQNEIRDPFCGHEVFTADEVPADMQFGRKAPQPRDEHGRFVSRARKAAPSPQRVVRKVEAPRQHQAPTPYDGLDKDALANIINRNLWGSEIDLANATKQQMVNFLIDKERAFAEVESQQSPRQNEPRKRQEAPRAETRQAPQPNGNVNDPRVVGLLNGMLKLIEQNPQLAEQLSKFGQN